MNYLTDTNILLRLVQTSSQHHTTAKNAVDKLLKQGDTLFVTLQNISEFWNVCTRPADKNGLGFTAAIPKRNWFAKNYFRIANKISGIE